MTGDAPSPPFFLWPETRRPGVVPAVSGQIAEGGSAGGIEGYKGVAIGAKHQHAIAQNGLGRDSFKRSALRRPAICLGTFNGRPRAHPCLCNSTTG